MARTTIVIASLFLVAGLIVALLPAQETSSRRSAHPEDPTPAEKVPEKLLIAVSPKRLPQPGIIQPHEPRPLAPNLRAKAYPILPAGGEAGTSTLMADGIGPIAADGTGQPRDSAYAPADSEAADTKSVLKRPRPLPMADAVPMQSAAGNSGSGTAGSDPQEEAPPAAPQIRPRDVRPPSPITAREAPSVAPEEPAAETEQTPAGPPSSRRTMRPTTKAPQSTAGKSAGPAEQLSAESKHPSIRVQVTGPAALTVGKPGKYVLHVINEGAATVEDIQVRLPLPAWVKISAAESTGGEAQLQADGAGLPRLVWNLPAVKSQGHDELHLQLVAAEGQPFDLSADWTCRTPGAIAHVSVRQPQLDLALAAPSDMLFGEEKVCTVTVSNPGSGDASGVVVQIATGGNRPKDVDIGNIAAGEQVEVPVQIVANQAGELQLRATASGDGGLKAEAATKILIRRPQLAIAVEAPELKFAGTEATYLVTVTNSGNASAEDVQLSIQLPSGAKYLGGVSGGAASKGGLSWKVGSIAAGTQKQFDVRCLLLVEGANRLAATVNGKAGLAASGEGVTEVEAVSDLKLAVNDPSGPTPVGQEVVYELQVMNRGSRSARNVKILMQFGNGLEPIELTGGQGKLVPGQVVCDPLPELAAGEQVTLRVKARAEKTGSHRYRVEVTSGEEDARLVSEGTSRFFDSKAGAAARTAKKPAKELSPSGTIQR